MAKKKKQALKKRRTNKTVQTKDGKDVVIKCMYEELVDSNKLKPHPGNPYQHSDDQVARLAANILHHGVTQRITVSRRSGLIISGHCRRDAGILLGIDFPVEYQDYDSEAHEVAVMISDNKIAELSEVIGQVMADRLVELDQVDYPIELTGMNEVEIRDCIDGPLGFEGIEGIDPPLLSEGNKPEFQQMTFVLHDSQVVVVQAAIDKTKASRDCKNIKNKNANGNALTWICERYNDG